MAAVFLWQVVLLCSSLTLASPQISRGLAPRQVAASSTSSANVDAAILGIIGAIQTGAAAGRQYSNQTSSGSTSLNSSITSGSGSSDSTTVPIVNAPIVLPWFSECTSGDTGTATFTSEFAHHTGFESIADDQAFWNDTSAVWKVQVVSPGYSIQALGLFEDDPDAVDNSAISLGSASSTFALTVPSYGCESACIPPVFNLSSFTTTRKLAFLRNSLVL